MHRSQLGVLILLTSVAGGAFLAAQTSSNDAAGTPLFNGRDLTGWKVPAGDNGHWKVVDGVIDYDAESEAPGDKHLWTEGSYGDFVLRLDWRLNEHAVREPQRADHPLRRHAQEERGGPRHPHCRCRTPTRVSTCGEATRRR